MYLVRHAAVSYARRFFCSLLFVVGCVHAAVPVQDVNPLLRLGTSGNAVAPVVNWIVIDPASDTKIDPPSDKIPEAHSKAKLATKLETKLETNLETKPETKQSVLQSAVVPASSQVPAELLNEPAYLNRDVLGAGDQIQVSVFGQPDLSAEVTVSENGTITLPLIGTVLVRGKSTSEVEKMFAQRLLDGHYLRDPKVAVQVEQQRSRAIYVLGEVQKPGRIPLQGQLSILDALSIAGGLTANADVVALIVRHTDRDRASRNSSGNTQTADQNQVITFPLQMDKLTGSSRGLLGQTMVPDDVIYVGKRKVFFVNGEVRKPGMYVMEDDLTVMRVLSIGGGVSDRGSMSRIMIHRKDATNKIVELPAKLTDVVLPGDVVFVKERLF